MVSFIKQMMKRIGIFAGVVFIALTYPIHHASAEWYDFLGINNITENALTNIFTYLINFFIGGIAKILLWIGIEFVKWSIEINHTIAVKSSFASFGWGITLNLANFLIVIGIVVIAFGTMFRREWGMKLLPKLIIIALLINFSYFIAVELITVADKITIAFLDTTNASDQWTKFAEFFAVSADGVGWNFAEISGKIGEGIVNLASPLVAIAFTYVAFLSLCALAVAFLIRYVIITILLILLPVALVMSIFPVTVGAMNVWQKWKDEFIKWLLFGPIMAFFIYLAFALLKHPPTTTSGFITVAGRDMGNYIALIGILLGGLFMAKKLGVAGTGIVQAGVNFAGSKFQQLTQKRAIMARSRAEQWEKQGEKGKAFRAKLIGGMYKGMTYGTQQAKGALLQTWGGKAEETPKLASISQKIKDENWSDLKINKEFARLSKNPDDPDFHDLVAYGLKEGKVENPRDYLTEDIERGLIRAGKDNIYKDIEKAAVGTRTSFQQMQTDTDAAAQTMKDVFGKVKVDKNFGKNVGVAKVFEGDDAAHQETVAKWLVMHSPEAISESIKLVRPQDKAKFIKTFENVYLNYSYQGKVDPRVEKFTGTPGYKKLFE